MIKALPVKGFYLCPAPQDLATKDEDFITRYNKSRKVDKPFIATISP
jgi:hypothetical protein